MMSVAIAFVLALGPSVACATGEEGPKSAPPPMDDSPSLLDAGAADASDERGASTPSTCSESGFCYESLPVLGPILAVSASSADDAWMVPERSGVLLRWDGTSVTQAYAYDGAAPSNITFARIWAKKKDDVWAAAQTSDGQLFVVRYASAIGGGAPAFRELATQVSTSAILSVWGQPAGDSLWIVTDHGVLRVREDASGALVDDMSPALGAEDAHQYSWRGVWGFGPDDIYVAGRVCPPESCEPSESRGVLAHYDGTSWSITAIESASELLSLHGTAPGSEHQLWYDCREPELSSGPFGETIYVDKTYLVPVTNEGHPGAPLYSRSMKDVPACASRVGDMATPSSGWFSGGLLVCRWTGTTFEPVKVALGDRPIVEKVNGIWAGAEDDVWIVGAAVTRPGLPARGFAARRTKATLKGGP